MPVFDDGQELWTRSPRSRLARRFFFPSSTQLLTIRLAFVCLFCFIYRRRPAEREDAALSFGHIFTSNLFRLLFRQYWAHAAAKTRQRKRKTDDYFFPFNKKKEEKTLEQSMSHLSARIVAFFSDSDTFFFIPTAHWIEKPQRSLLLNISCI